MKDYDVGYKMNAMARCQREFKVRRDYFLLVDLGRLHGASGISARPGGMGKRKEILGYYVVEMWLVEKKRSAEFVQRCPVWPAREMKEWNL